MIFAVCKIKHSIVIFIIFCIISIIFVSALPKSKQVSGEDFIKWMDFNANTECMKDAMRIDIETSNDDYPICWTDIIAYLACIYGNDFSGYSKKDMEKFVDKIKSGKTIEELTANLKYFNYYKETYEAALGGFIGDYEITIKDEKGNDLKISQYGLKAFSPIADGYSYNHYSDFGASRNYGYERKHLGNDIMGSVGTPIVAVEGGVVEAVGWNRYGGWRIGIRSPDKKRYYYYAHLRKDHPYSREFKSGDTVNAGEVIGYLGMTGYSQKENVNNISIPHLHFGMQIIFDESQKDGTGEIWIDVFSIVNILSQNKSKCL